MKKLSEKTLNYNGIERDINEVFLQIPGWKKYYVSNYGRVISLKDNGTCKLLKPQSTKDGYLQVTLNKPARTYNGEKVRKKDGSPKNVIKREYVHRLVSQMFLKNPYPYPEFTLKDLDTHHKNHKKHDNRDKNLMYLANGQCCTRSDHRFIDNIKKIAVYTPETAKYYGYSDIEMLCKRVNLSILELIDVLKDDGTCRIKDGEWTVYKVNEYYIGVQKYKKNTRNKKKK